ncbi:selenocysteine-specific translation elongation factor [uncultured Aquitalea sp.]|uniref:selenocysteine-specific translation elongation factor n=1 Tax=uncultured Aquitalea sp. TaxID=540272 RepID=UPI0025D59A9D|nr:selenocysteine-specific translation elongation factor [uncultured Aquitalea sp.]
MIFATAGHVDHGKTTLLHALTGQNADRLPEEKKRGMTIDLGYAYLPLPDGRTLGFIDVPGHEKFLGNMLAGMGGIRHALLVVAADDGPMPQTREHLDIIRLLGIPGLTLIITKADRAGQDQLEQVQVALRALLTGSRHQDAPCFVVDSLSGSGIDGLRQHLAALSDDQEQRGGRFRLAVDRAFTLSGAGLVVTGTALSGKVAVGDTLFLSPDNRPVRVRGLHAQNAAAAEGRAGQRLAINISGDVEKSAIRRGDCLLSQTAPTPSLRLTVELETLSTLSHWQSAHVHHAAGHVVGRIALLESSDAAPNQTVLAELALEQPLMLAEGDRIILRDASARHTLGAATVQELHPPVRGKRRPERLDYLRQLAAASGAAARLRLQSADHTLECDTLGWALQLTDPQLKQQLNEAGLIQAGKQLFEQTRWRAMQDRLLEKLAVLHQHQPDQLGASRGRLRRLALPQETDATLNRLVDDMLAEGRLKQTRGWLHLPEHSVSFTTEESTRWQAVETCFAGQQDALWVRDIASALALDEQETRTLLTKAARLGHVSAIVPDRYLHSAAVAHMASIVRQLAQSHGYADAAGFRNQIGTGRKLAIQILEFFDRSGFTRRAGDRHFLREALLFGQQEQAAP